MYTATAYINSDMFRITCDGERVLSVTFESHSGDAGYIVELSISMLLVLLAGVTLFSLIKIIFREISIAKTSLLYIILIGVGGTKFMYQI